MRRFRAARWASGALVAATAAGAVTMLNAPEAAAGTCGTLGVNESLAVNASVVSCNGQYRLQNQSDGNLVLYRQADNHPMWFSKTSTSQPGPLVMQGDGNLVLHTATNQPLFFTATMVRDSTLSVQDDGNAVVYAPGGKHVWDTFSVNQQAAMQAATQAAAVAPLAPMHFSCALLGQRCKDNVAEPSNWALSPVVYNAVDYYYLHPDLSGMNAFDLTRHYIEHGRTELRQSSAAFDPEYYRSVHPDLAGMDGGALVKHFFEHGIREGRRPSLLFDFNVYRTYGDLAAMSNAELILHYVQHGVYEGRRASAEFQIASGVWGRAPILRGQVGIDLGNGAGRQNLPAEFLPVSNVVAFSVNGQPAIGAITPNAGEVLIALDPAQGVTGPIYDQNWASDTMRARGTNAANMPFSGPFTDMGWNGALRGLGTGVGLTGGALYLNQDIGRQLGVQDWAPRPELPQPRLDTNPPK